MTAPTSPSRRALGSKAARDFSASTSCASASRRAVRASRGDGVARRSRCGATEPRCSVERGRLDGSGAVRAARAGASRARPCSARSSRPRRPRRRRGARGDPRPRRRFHPAGRARVGDRARRGRGARRAQLRRRVPRKRHAFLRAAWADVRPALLGRAPCPPRVWATWGGTHSADPSRERQAVALHGGARRRTTPRARPQAELPRGHRAHLMPRSSRARATDGRWPS